MSSVAPLRRSPAAVLEELLAGHQRFISGQPQHLDNSLERLREVSLKQTPFAAILGCADSRVPVELLFDIGFGDLFVVRNAGNTPFTAAIGSMEYAVEHLGVPLILVLGHKRCGAVQAALNPDIALTPSLEQLIGRLRLDLWRRQELPELAEACRQNTIHAARTLAASSVLITDHIRSGALAVVAAFFDLDTGGIEVLETVNA